MTKNRVEMLRLQHEVSWNQENWYPPLASALEGLGPAEAAWRPPGGGNTIWQIVNHLNYYDERILRHLTGEAYEAGEDNDATFGEPGSPDDEAGWQATVERTRRIAEGLREALAALREEELSDRLAHTLSRWMPHGAYHTGQIVLLRRLQGCWPAQG